MGEIQKQTRFAIETGRGALLLGGAYEVFMAKRKHADDKPIRKSRSGYTWSSDPKSETSGPVRKGSGYFWPDFPGNPPPCRGRRKGPRRTIGAGVLGLSRKQIAAQAKKDRIRAGYAVLLGRLRGDVTAADVKTGWRGFRRLVASWRRFEAAMRCIQTDRPNSRRHPLK